MRVDRLRAVRLYSLMPAMHCGRPGRYYTDNPAAALLVRAAQRSRLAAPLAGWIERDTGWGAGGASKRRMFAHGRWKEAVDGRAWRPREGWQENAAVCDREHTQVAGRASGVVLQRAVGPGIGGDGRYARWRRRVTGVREQPICLFRRGRR